jgi:hypothetical protein
MDKKIGRNESCPCGSGKKYKQCCLLNKRHGLKGLKATWVNKKAPDLFTRTFSQGIKKGESEGFVVEEKKDEKPLD